MRVLRNLTLLRNSFASLLEFMRGASTVGRGFPSPLGRNRKQTQSLGDIMSLRETLVSLPKEFSSLERILLTANGNVQRILKRILQPTHHRQNPQKRKNIPTPRLGNRITRIPNATSNPRRIRPQK
ncbi:hypothetical protein CcCBS67573_g08600 [Chytriomyces confervae]|uniref:Uncharacterized protein n=1 Tax=Chytriomyces confervae TaxID=246404 RepID=A0A507EK09_9FUNG|nr:hypothetical protein CcCBS67573_g08600 [Chytriomyces confervae]